MHSVHLGMLSTLCRFGKTLMKGSITFSRAVFATVVTTVQVWYRCRPIVAIAEGESVGGQFKLPGSSCPSGGVGPEMYCFCFCVSRQHYYL